MQIDHGHVKRENTRRSKYKKDCEKIKTIIDTAWAEKEYGTTNPISDFYQIVKERIGKEVKGPDIYYHGRVKLANFIRKLNKEFNTNYPEPSVPIKLKREQPTKDLDWLVEGSKIADLAIQATKHWSKQTTYTSNEIIGWTLFSAIVWGGLNDEAALSNFLDTLVMEKPILSFTQEANIIFLEAEDPSYGNSFEDDKLNRSFNFIPDDITRCWLLKIKKKDIKVKEAQSIETLLNLVLSQLDTQIKYPRIGSNSVLLKFASYHWEQILGVRIDQATSSVLTHKQKCCSMTQTEFALFYNASFNTNRFIIDTDDIYVGKPDRQNFSKEVSVPEQQARSFTSEIRRALNPKKLDEEKLLLALKRTFGNESEKRLAAWIYDLVTRNSPKLKKSSILRYMDAVAIPWLVLTLNKDILRFESFDFEELYQEIIANKSINGKSFDARQLHQFHQFQVRNFNAPRAHLSITNKFQRCRAKVISKDTFNAICNTLNLATGMSDPDKLTFLLVFILAYRTGMRREEILGLQFRDIEYGDNLSFIIRSSAAGKLKTSSALRRIPVWALLRKTEILQLQKYLNNEDPKLNRPSAAVFSINSKQSRLPTESPSRLIKTLLNHILSNHSYTFHSFRHTALSNLSLILHARSDLIRILTDYDEEDCLRIRQGLLGHQHAGQDRWFALAQVAGHADPDHTFQHYLHFVHLMGGFEISSGAFELSLHAIKNITGYDARKIYRHNDSAMDHQRSKVSLNKIRRLITKELTPPKDDWQKNSARSSEILTNGELNIDPLEIMNNQLPGSDFNKISMTMVHSILSKLEAGDTVTEVTSRYSIPQEIVNRWVKNSEQLFKLNTIREHSKLFTKGRLVNHPDLLLAPHAPMSDKEQKLIGSLFANAVNLHREHPQVLHQFLDIFFERVFSTRTEIRFTKSETTELKNFYDTGVKLLTVSNWRLHAPSEDEGKEFKKHQQLSRSLSIMEDKSGDYDGYFFTIKHPDEDQILKNRPNLDYFSSPLLKYACHMLAIADPKYVIKNS